METGYAGRKTRDGQARFQKAIDHRLIQLSGVVDQPRLRHQSIGQRGDCLSDRPVIHTDESMSGPNLAVLPGIIGAEIPGFALGIPTGIKASAIGLILRLHDDLGACGRRAGAMVVHVLHDDVRSMG